MPLSLAGNGVRCVSPRNGVRWAVGAGRHAYSLHLRPGLKTRLERWAGPGAGAWYTHTSSFEVDVRSAGRWWGQSLG
eukprot:145282-Prymnesium_polylepis.1